MYIYIYTCTELHTYACITVFLNYETASSGSTVTAQASQQEKKAHSNLAFTSNNGGSTRNNCPITSKNDVLIMFNHQTWRFPQLKCVFFGHGLAMFNCPRCVFSLGQVSRVHRKRSCCGCVSVHFPWLGGN